jgi:peptidoglycan hydrolase-like protein with peptidoglycan-binding domain
MARYVDATINSVLTGPTLRPWDVEPAVVELQELLRAHGFRVSVTGEFDSSTEDAVLIFQRRKGVRVDAIVGPKTWAALKQEVKPGSRPLRKGHSGMDVYELQGLLRVNGYAIARDGFFTDETKDAVMAFQTSHKLRETGQVDRTTWSLLQNKGR